MHENQGITLCDGILQSGRCQMNLFSKFENMSINQKRSYEVENSPAQAEPRESPAEPASPLPPSTASKSNIEGSHASSPLLTL